MKQVYLIAILFASFFANAQITIDQTDMPSAGDMVVRSLAGNFTGTNFTTTGTNFAWNFFSLDSTSGVKENYFNITSAPFTALFVFGPFGGNASSQMYKIGGNPLNFGNIGGGLLPFNIDSTYEYYKKNGTRFAKTGYSLNLNGFPVPLAFDSNDVLYKLPLNFGNADSGISIFEIGNNPLLKFLYYNGRTKRVNKVDGWGTIVLPYNNTPVNVLRVKSEIYASDTIHIDTTVTIAGVSLPLNQGFRINRPKQVEYKWLAKGKDLPVLQVTGTEAAGVFTPTEVRYLFTPYPASLNNYNNQSINVWPNPAKNSLSFSASKNIEKVMFYNFTGQIIKEEKINNQKEFNLPLKLSAGLYQVKILMEDGVLANKTLTVE